MSVRWRTAGFVAALVLGIGLFAGLRAGAASAGHAGISTGTTTGVTVTEPVVTAVVPPAQPAADLPGSGKPTVLIADENIPEQFIIGQLYATALSHEGYKVIVSRNLGPYDGRVPALQHGTLDLYPQDLGAWNSRIAHLHSRFHTLAASYGAGDRFARRHGLSFLRPTPFSDTSCVAVLKQYAEENHVYSIPELARGGGIIFGAPIEFQDMADGLPVLEHAYRLHPGYLESIGTGVQYWWLNTGNVDATYCNTTDPQLAGPKYVQLSDPKHVFGYGNIVPVTTPQVLKKEGPVFRDTINQIDALLTLRAMRGLDAEYDLGRQNPAAIAYQFLEGNGILPPSRYAPVPTATATTVATTSTQAGGGAPPCACMYSAGSG